MRNIIFEETILLVIIIMVSFILLSRFGHVDLPGSFNQDKNGSFTLFHEISESWTNILTGAGTLGPAVEPLNETTTNSTAEGNESTTNVTSANESTNILPEEPPSPSESRTLGSQGELGIQTTDVTSCTTLSANGNFTLNSSVSATGTCFDFGGRNITLDCKGFSVTYGTSAAGNAMLIGSGDHNPVVKNCRIVQGASGSSAISVTLAGNFTILNNTINTSTGIGIEVQRREGVIMNNTIRVTGSVQGISLSNPPCGNITIDGNLVNVSGSGTSAFAIETGCAGTNITNNVLSSRFTVVHVSNGDNHNILSNVINMTQTPVTGHEAGILFDTGFAGKSRIAENKIKSTEDGIAITVGTADNGVFSHNMIDCRFQCIEISAGGATGPQDNIFVNNNITATEGQEISDASTSTVNYLIYNNSLGEIKWLNNGTGSFLLDLSININNDQGIGLGKNLFIGNNTAALNSSAFSTGKMNFSQANVTLRGLGIPSVTAVMRLANFTTVEADIINKGSNCNGTTCRIVSYDNTIGTLIFNTTRFSSFAANRTLGAAADTVPPSVVIVNPANGSNLSNGLQAFNATVTDSASAVETVRFSFSNASGIPFNVTATNLSGNWNANVNITTLAEGPHTMTVFANDTAGNVNDTVFIQFTVDRTPPRVVINVPANGTNVSDRITDLLVFNTPIRDTNLSIYAVIFRFDNATGNDFNVTAVNVSGNWSTTLNLSRLVDGFHAMTVSANDTNGNLNSTEFVEFTVDRTAPTVIFLNPSNESNLSGGLQAFNATVIDSLTQVNVVLFQFTNGTRPFNVTAANRSGNWNANVNISTIVEGLTTITVFANDTLNNVNNTQTINIHVDLAAPNVNIVNSSFSTTSTTPSITFNFTDNVSLSANCSLYLNNIFNVSNAATPNNTNTILTASTLNIASYEATVNCTDGSGNTGNSTAITITITAVPEEIGAPPAAPSGGGGVKVAPVVECKTDADCPVDKYCVAGFCEKIFDLKILSLDSPIEPGEFLDFTYYVKAMANISGDVTFDFFVKKADETFSSGSDVIFMGDREEKIESAQVFLPTTLADGTYIFSIQLHFGRYEVNSHRTFEVKHEVPLLPTLTLLDLFPVKSGIAWNYSAILSVNKDVLVPVTFERSITKEGAQVWFKKEKITLNRTLVVVDQVDGLEEGTYILHAVMYAADENASAERTFSITKEGALQLPEEGKHLPQLQKEKKALFGAAIAGKAISTARSYWLPLLLLLLIALGTVVVLVVTKKKMRTGKVVQELDIDKLELWMGKATAASMSRENMMMAANKAGWSTEQVRTALARIEAIQKFHQAYGKALPEKTVQAFKAFVAMQARMGIDKKEVINKLVRQGWKKESIERFVEAYY